MKQILAWLVSLLLFPLGIAAQNSIPGVDGPIYAIKVYKTTYQCGNTCCELTQLIVGGAFSHAGSVAANNVAIWDGTAWQALGTGVNGPVYAIEAVARFGGDGLPDVYVGGDFTDKGVGFARWSESTGSWSGASSSLSSTGFNSLYSPGYVTVRSIKNMGGALWLGGRFYQGGTVVSPNIISYNLTSLQWQGIGTQTVYANGSSRVGSGIFSPLVTVTGISSSGNAVVAIRNSVPSQPFAPVNPADSEGFYSLVGTVFYGGNRPAIMHAVVTDNGTIVGHDQVNPSAWSPATWDSSIGRYSGVSELNGSAWQLLGYNGNALPPAGASPWTPVGSTPSGWKAIGSVSAMVSYNGSTYIGGTFTSVYGADASQQIAEYTGVNNIFKWTPGGSPRWSKLQNPAVGCSVGGAAGVNGPVYAMDVDYNSCNGQFRGVWVAGDFTQAGPLAVSRIAFWNGTQWSAAGNVAPVTGIQGIEPSDQVYSGPNGWTTLHGLLLDGYACDSDGTIASVDFYVNGTFLASAYNVADPLAFWQPSAAGTYQITTVAIDNQGAQTVSAQFPYTVTTPPAPPTAPTGLALLSLSATQVQLSWADNSGEEYGYYVERSTDGVNFIVIDTLPFNTASYVDTTLSANTKYFYRVRAFHFGAASGYSNVASIMNVPAMCISKIQDGTEAGTKPTFRIQRPAADFRSVTVGFSVSGSAVSGSDYSSMGTSITIPANAAYVDLQATPLQDSQYEGTETIVVSLAAGAGYTVGAGCGSASANLVDDEAVPTITAYGAYSANEGGAPGYFYIVPSVTVQHPLTIYFTVTGTATPGTDYYSIGNYFTIPAGTQGGSYASLQINAIDDSLLEPSETITLTMSANAGYVIGGTGTATVSVLDNEATSVYVVATDASASETGPNTGQFTVYRQGGTASQNANPLTVPISISGTATSGVDFVSLPTSVTIPANQSTFSFTVTPIDDALHEGSETVIVTLSQPNQSTFVVGSPATVTIADND